MHQMIWESLPEDPPRDSYWFWVKLARQYTGQHFLDSGGAYGYNFERGYKPEDADPITVEIWDNKEVNVYVDLPMYLHSMLDASEGVSEELEQVLDFVGNWLYGGEHWGRCIQELDTFLSNMEDYVAKGDERTLFYKKRFADDYLRWHYNNKFDHFTYNQRKLSEDEYVEAALEELPVKAIKKCVVENVREIENERGFLTYNSDNDFNQDFQCDAMYDDGWCRYVIIRTHNGCDIRGGYSSPVVAALRDYAEDYFWTWQVDAYCHECGEQWESLWWYGKAYDKVLKKYRTEIIPGLYEVKISKGWPTVFEGTANEFTIARVFPEAREWLEENKNQYTTYTKKRGDYRTEIKPATRSWYENIYPHEPPTIDEIEGLRERALNELNGQLKLGDWADWTHPIDPDVILALYDAYQELLDANGEREEWKTPIAIHRTYKRVDGEAVTDEITVPEPDMNAHLPGGGTELWCPYCQAYSVVLWHPVNGY
jgi:hypothetical protein